MVMQVAWRCTNATIQHIGIEMDERESYLPDLEKKSYCELRPVMPSLFGESSETIALTREPESDRAASTARHSETKVKSSLPTLYARRAQSLLTAGLIAGITHTSIRKRYGADCREIVSLWQAGDMCELEAGESGPEAAN